MHCKTTPPTVSTPLPEVMYPLDPPYPEPYEQQDPHSDLLVMKSLETANVTIPDDVRIFQSHFLHHQHLIKLKEVIESHLNKGSKSCKVHVHVNVC